MEAFIEYSTEEQTYLTSDHLFQLRTLDYCIIDGAKYRDKLFTKTWATAYVNCQDDQLLAESEEGYFVLIPVE